MGIIVGSARHDEKGGIIGGKAGDQTGKEVSTQAFYVHKKGWYILRPKSVEHANKIAERMLAACNNNNIGYDQGERLGVNKYGIDTKVPVETDCSGLVRQCVKEATGKDPGNFITSNEATALEKTGLFEKRVSYTSQSKTPVYDGDVLVTKSKGHTVIVVSGNKRSGGADTSEKNTSTVVNKDTSKVDVAKYMDKGNAGIYSVTASSLNVRSGAGTDKDVITVIPKNTRVVCYGYYNKDKNDGIWLYVQLTHNAKQYTGYCSKKYLSKN